MNSILIRKGNLNTLFNRMSEMLQPLNSIDKELDWPFPTVRNKSTDYTTYKEDSNQVIEMALLGYEKKDIDIDITENVLTIKSKIDKNISTLVNREFSESYNLPDNSEVDKIGATLSNGLLKVVVPLAQPKVFSKKIKIS